MKEVSRYEIEKELGNHLNRYYTIEEEINQLNLLRPSSAAAEKDFTKDLINEASKIAYWAGQLLDKQ